MVTAAFTTQATANACVVHGPLAPTDATAKTVEVVTAHAAGGDVALPNGDALVDELGLTRALEAAGLRLLHPNAGDWDTRLRDAAVGVTSAALGVAATGTLAITSGPGAPRALSLLPPVHVCVLRARDLVPEFADAIHRVAETELPSVLIWVGGPSRTADLEMIQTVGVHGPKVVELVLVT